MPSFSDRRRGNSGVTFGVDRTTRMVAVLGAALFALGTLTAHAQAQQQATGFASERFNTASPGAAWLVMDDLNLDGKLGGAVAVFGGYARNPYHVDTPDLAHRLDVVSNQAFVDVGLAVLYHRYRMYLNIANPLSVTGKSGTVGGYEYTAADVNVSKYPDKVMDVRLGMDTRLLGEVNGPFRLGVGAQLIVPSGEKATYVTDGTYRAMFRLLFAGSPSFLAYAGHIGLHIRPRDNSPMPGGPQGSELLFGIAAGPRLKVTSDSVIVVGPEIYGQTAFRSLLGSTATGLEALLTGRFEQSSSNASVTRVKFGFGEGIHSEFGAPEWRCVFALELMGRVR